MIFLLLDHLLVARSPVKTINDVKVISKGNSINLQFRSKSFLQNQVRSMVGCLKYLACKEWNLKNLKKFLNLKIENFALRQPLLVDYI